MPPIFRLCALSVLCFLSSPIAAFAQEKPIYDQVVDIVASETGTIRRWAYPPKLTVIHSGDPHSDLIHGLVDMVNLRIPNFPGVGEVEFFDLARYNRRLAGNTQFRMPTKDYNGVEGSIVRALFQGEAEDQDLSVTGSIFIFLTGLENGITFGALTQSNQRLSRQFAEGGETRCYFNLMSLRDELRAGFIFINTEDAQTPVAECIYEEFMQTLGLLNDSHGSSIFTFDNTGTVREDRNPDFRLLEALYSDQIAPGDDAQRVADLYLNIAPADVVEVADKP